MNTPDNIPNVNAHLHTPYSFSAFEKLTDALEKAAKENVSIAGINDFYSTDGYLEWNTEARKRHLYPLFNIEFISLSKEDRDNGIRVNDPNNPGRTYISGKGLKCPPKLEEQYSSQMKTVRDRSNAQV
jgi:DNA polymerase III alpha subunit